MTRWSHLLLCTLLLAGGDASPAAPATVIEGQSAPGRYDDPVLGWSMQRPPGWSVMSPDEVDAQARKGRALLEETLGERVEMNHTNLLHLRSNRKSVFTSTREYYDESAGPYAAVQETLFQAVRESFATADIPIRVERRRETIDGVAFQLMQVSMRARDDESREIMQQYLYNALVRNQCFTVTVTAVTTVDDAELEAGLRAWRASKFAKRP